MTLSAQQLAALKQALEKGLARLSKQQMGAWALSNPGPTKVRGCTCRREGAGHASAEGQRGEGLWRERPRGQQAGRPRPARSPLCLGAHRERGADRVSWGTQPPALPWPQVSTLHMLEPFVRAAKGPAKSK